MVEVHEGTPVRGLTPDGRRDGKGSEALATAGDRILVTDVWILEGSSTWSGSSSMVKHSSSNRVVVRQRNNLIEEKRCTLSCNIEIIRMC